jgi:hypothetical protein
MTRREAYTYIRDFHLREVARHDERARQLANLIPNSMDAGMKELWESELQFHREATQRNRELIQFIDENMAE